MSVDFSEYLETVQIPCFLLAHNLNFEHAHDLDTPVSRGEIIKCSNNIEELRALIPVPPVPDDDYKQYLFEKKIGDIKTTPARFDDSPYDLAEGDPNDYEIFGESYTIVWLCPPDENEVTDYLVSQYRTYRDLITIWDYFIDRIHVFPFYSLEVISDDFYENICDSFEEKVNKISDPPSEKEWNELNDYL